MEIHEVGLDQLIKEHSSAWDELVAADDSGILGLDVTSMAEWMTLLPAMLLPTQSPRYLIATQDSRLCGVMPVVEERVGPRGLRRRSLKPLSEWYGNRQGFVAEDPQAFFAAILNYLDSRRIVWDEILLTATHGARSEAGLLASTSDAGYAARVVAEFESPYIELPASWDEYLASLPKKFRWLLRTSRSKLEDAGEVEYRQCLKPDQVAQFLTEIEEIERASWKEDAGTSITTNDHQADFYQRFLPVAAERGWLSGHTLAFKGEPIAYILGMEFGGVCLDLKESYKVDYRSNSPGHVLKTFAFPELIARGITTYDFSGLCEPYKLKWTAKTYHRYRYAIHSKTLKGRLWARVAARQPVIKEGRHKP